jgi:hypothetical protein
LIRLGVRLHPPDGGGGEEPAGLAHEQRADDEVRLDEEAVERMRLRAKLGEHLRTDVRVGWPGPRDRNRAPSSPRAG